jgi:demethylmenaquinone methyltransferase/2-methoxy-6-polyprenyl-1,4-benzoquinol methylase
MSPADEKSTAESSHTTHFGFQQVPLEDKAGKVAGVFTSVAQRYDVMNDVMSFGLHRLWKRYTLDMSDVRSGQRVLDLAGGTGDLASKFSSRVGAQGEVVIADINAAMLQRGRARLTDQGIAGNVTYVQADAETLPFPADYFDCITMAFGLRNVTRKERALAAMQRVLKPGGRVLILEFSKLKLPVLQPLYDAYSFKILPFMGRLITQDADSYRYLAESIRMHPDQDTLKAMLEQAGFSRCDYFNLSGGIVALHRGYKF